MKIPVLLSFVLFPLVEGARGSCILSFVILAEAGQIYQSSELTLLRRVGDLPLVMSINSTTHHEDLRLIESMRFAAFPVVKLQQSSEVYCHTESDTNLHGNDIILIYNTIHPGFATPQEGNNTFLYLFPS